MQLLEWNFYFMVYANYILNSQGAALKVFRENSDIDQDM